MRAFVGLIFLVLSACDGVAPKEGDELPFAPVAGGHVTWTFGDKVFRIAAADGAEREDVSAALQAPLPGRDRWLSPSLDGSFFALSSERFSGNGEVLVRATANLADVEVVVAGGAEIFLETMPAINIDGTFIVYASQGGPHDIDLFRTDRSSDGTWSAPQLLTAASPYASNGSPALRFDQGSVLFDCGAERSPESGNSDSCEVGVDGTGFAVLVSPDALPNSRNDYTQFPHPSTRGVVFQGSWPIAGDSPETIWRLEGTSPPTPATPTFNNAVSPCGLPDGRMVMLWLDRDENTLGAHELTLVDADDETFTTLVPLEDVSDIGIGCSD